AILCEIHGLQRRQVEAEAAAFCAARPRELALHEVLHVLLEDAFLGTAALHAPQIHAELARVAAHSRTRVRPGDARVQPCTRVCSLAGWFRSGRNRARA